MHINPSDLGWIILLKYYITIYIIPINPAGTINSANTRPKGIHLVKTTTPCHIAKEEAIKEKGIPHFNFLVFISGLPFKA